MPNPNARHLRKNPTDTERRLWIRLRARQVNGQMFRRQRPVGPYIVDFMCVEQGLIIEVDGSQHMESERDAARDFRYTLTYTIYDIIPRPGLDS